MGQNKIISLMGSPGSGKTTTAVKLAVELSRAKKNVIIVCCDPFVPAIPYLLAAATNHEISLGSLLTAPALSQKEILKACIPVERNEYISFLGYRSGESLMHFPKITRDKAVEFFVLLRYLADCIIVDCSSVFEADLTSIIAIEMADQVLKLGTANLKGISYFQTHNIMLADSKFQKDRQTNVISNVKTGQEWGAVGQQYGGAPFILSYLLELEQQCDELSLFSPLTSKEGAIYTAQIRKLLQEIFPLESEQEERQSGYETVSEKKSGMKKPGTNQPGTKQLGEVRKVKKGNLGFKLSFGKQKGEF